MNKNDKTETKTATGTNNLVRRELQRTALKYLDLGQIEINKLKI